MSKVQEFREAINANEEWQEEVRNFGDDDNMVSYASGKGYEFTTEEYVEKESEGELSGFELELVAGGLGSPSLKERYKDRNKEKTSTGFGRS